MAILYTLEKKAEFPYPEPTDEVTAARLAREARLQDEEAVSDVLKQGFEYAPDHFKGIRRGLVDGQTISVHSKVTSKNNKSTYTLTVRVLDDREEPGVSVAMTSLEDAFGAQFVCKSVSPPRSFEAEEF